MKTNYQNLTGFEAAAVFVAIIGIGLIGFEVYVTLPQRTQIEVVAAFEIFDVREPVAKTVSAVDTVLAITEENFKQFELAFIQTFSFPEEIGEPLIAFGDSFANYSEAIAANYMRNNFEFQSDAGRVAGASITAPVEMPKPIETELSDVIPYKYETPSLIKKFIN